MMQMCSFVSDIVYYMCSDQLSSVCVFVCRFVGGGYTYCLWSQQTLEQLSSFCLLSDRLRCFDPYTGMCSVQFEIAWSSSGNLLKSCAVSSIMWEQLFWSSHEAAPRTFMPCRMDFDSGMQQTASAAAAPQAHVSMPIPVYAVPALLFFGQIPADAETIAHFQSGFGSALGSKLDLLAIHRQAHTAAVAAHAANAGAPPPFQSRDIMMSEVTLPAYGWSPLNPGFAFPVPHYNGQPAGVPASGGGIMIPQAPVYQPSSEAVNGSECITDDVDAMQSAEVTNSNDDDDEGNTGNMLLQGADHVDARGRYICEYPSDQLSMVQESMGDAGGGRDIEDVTHDKPPLSSVMEEGSDRGGEGTVAASFQQLQLHVHRSETGSTADDDRDAQAGDVATVLQQPVAAEKKKRKPRKSKSASAASHGNSDTLCNLDVADHDPAANAASGITTDVVDPATPPVKKKQRVSYRRGPPSKSSEFLGVTHYQRTGRWEAHIW